MRFKHSMSQAVHRLSQPVILFLFQIQVPNPEKGVRGKNLALGRARRSSQGPALCQSLPDLNSGLRPPPLRKRQRRLPSPLAERVTRVVACARSFAGEVPERAQRAAPLHRALGEADNVAGTSAACCRGPPCAGLKSRAKVTKSAKADCGHHSPFSGLGSLSVPIHRNA
jgi:hypothetical protein